MYVHKSKRRDGRTYLTLVEGYREGGKVKHKTIKSLGYLDELERIYEDPIAHFKAECAEANAAVKAEKQVLEISIHPQQKIDKKKAMRKNIGSAVLLALYSSLGIEQVIRNNTKSRKFSFDANAIMRLLVTERILNPGSKKSAWENKENYFFRSEFSLDDAYRVLGALAGTRDKMVSAINRSIDKMALRDNTYVFYDVTNYYFEIDDPDEAGGLRQRGMSKEHRKSSIVQMGLLQDASGIPIGYKLFPGNTVDAFTMLDVLSEMKRTYQQDRVIVVGDKGNNCSVNIAALVGKGDGFIYSQSIRGTKSDAELKGWVLEDKGYTYTYGEDGRATYKVKSKQGYKTLSVKDGEGTTHKVDIEVKYVAFWSEKYEKRARKERQAADEACDGYYCIVTSETGMSDSEIIDAYRELWRIEESFKVTKPELSTRPVFVSRQDHVEAHFLICYIALCILKIIQVMCAGAYSPARIAEELGAMCGTNLDGNWWIFNHRSDVSDDLCRMAGIDLTRQNMQLKDIKAVLAQAKRLNLSPNKKM